MATFMFSGGAYDDGETIKQAEEEFLKALKSVKEAEAAGSDAGDLSDLVGKLNRALILLDDAVEAYKSGREGEADRTALQSKTISIEVESASSALKVQALKSKLRLKVMVMILVPLLSLFSSLLAELVYSWWLEYSRKRFLKMRIKLAEGD